jgi:hypothetical protein
MRKNSVWFSHAEIEEAAAGDLTMKPLARFARLAMAAALLGVAGAGGGLAQAPPPAGKIDPQVAAALASGGKTQVLVIARKMSSGGQTTPVGATTLSQGLTQILRSEAPIIRETGAPGIVSASLDARGVQSLAARGDVIAIVPNLSMDHILEPPRAGAAARPLAKDTDHLIEVDRLHRAGLFGKGVTIAVIDDGVDGAHPMFSGALVGEACFSTHAPDAGMESLCPQQKSPSVGAGAAQNCQPDGSSCGHGTHVAGIALGRPVKSGQNVVTGVAPGAGLYMIRAAHRIARCKEADPERCVTFSVGDVLGALHHVTEVAERHRIRVVNLSLGGGNFPFNCDLIPNELIRGLAAVVAQLRAKGVVVVAAAGNSGSGRGIGQPACLGGVVSVGSIDSDGQVTSFSDSAIKVDLLAPGRDVLSAEPGGGLVRMNGTSMASPYAAGVIAALRAGFLPIVPDSSIVDALKRTGRYIRDPRNDLYFPVIQAWRATEAVLRAGGSGVIADGGAAAAAAPGTAAKTGPAPVTNAKPADMAAPPSPAAPAPPPAPAVPAAVPANDLLRSAVPVQ